MPRRDEILAFLESYLTPRALAFARDQLPNDYFESAEEATMAIKASDEEIVRLYCRPTLLSAAHQDSPYAKLDHIQHERDLRLLAKALLGKGTGELGDLRQLFGSQELDAEAILASNDPDVRKIRAHLRVCIVLYDLVNTYCREEARRFVDSVFDPAGSPQAYSTEDSIATVKAIFELRDLTQ